MAFAWFEKRAAPAPVAEAEAPIVATPSEPVPPTEAESAKAILELLELELGGMIRQLERAAGSVASGRCECRGCGGPCQCRPSARIFGRNRQPRRLDLTDRPPDHAVVPIRVSGRHWGGFRTAYKL